MTEDGLRDSTLVLLVLNEIDGLRETFDDLPIADFARTLAVDGGSTDGSVTRSACRRQDLAPGHQQRHST